MTHIVPIFEGETGEITVKQGAVSYKWKITNECAGSLICSKEGKEIKLKLIPMKSWYEFWK